MTENDVRYFLMCYQLGLVKSPFLEVGSAKISDNLPNLCELARQISINDVMGVDLVQMKGVDFVYDFAQPPDEFVKGWKWGSFATVAIFNVLEHTFDPITILQNCLHCVGGGGSLIVVTPVIWPLHDFPKDYVRLMPHWYEEFAERFSIQLCEDAFCWLCQFGIIKIKEFKMQGGYLIPTFLNAGKSYNPLRYWVSRVVHRLYNTYGRSAWFAHTAIGAAFIKP